MMGINPTWHGRTEPQNPAAVSPPSSTVAVTPVEGTSMLTAITGLSALKPPLGIDPIPQWTVQQQLQVRKSYYQLQRRSKDCTRLGLLLGISQPESTRPWSALLRSAGDIVDCRGSVRDENSGSSCVCAQDTALLCLIHAYDNAARFVTHRSLPVMRQHRIL